MGGRSEGRRKEEGGKVEWRKVRRDKEGRREEGRGGERGERTVKDLEVGRTGSAGEVKLLLISNV